jgi:hypothetical protein
MSSLATPTKFQDHLLELPEDINLFLGGGRGGGKSHGVALIILRHCVMYGEKAKVLCVRNQHKANSDFENLIESLFREAFGPKGYIRNRQEHSIRGSNGCTVEFGEINIKSYPKYQGRQFSKLVVDEAGEFTSLTYVDKLQSNLRQPGVPIQTIIISNPGGAQHVSLSKRYVSGRTPWRLFDIKGEPWMYCPSTLKENPHLDQKRYVNKLRASAGNDQGLINAWISGDWDAISGAFFSDVLSSALWFDDPWKPPPGTVWTSGWHTGIGIDWGFSAPCLVYFWAEPGWAGLEGPHGRIYPVGSKIILGELAVCDSEDLNVGGQWPPQMLAEAVLERCASFGVKPQGPCDDARGLEGNTLIQQLRQYGLACQRPVKDRISGWAKMKSMMAVAARYETDEFLDGPGLWVHDGCRYLAETLPTIPRNKLRMEDCDTTGPDHGVDCIRYICNHEAPMAHVSQGASIY